MGYLLLVIFWSVVWGFATKAVINNKGYDENWFWWGFFFGFIALIVAACKPENRNHYNYDSSSLVSEEKRSNQVIYTNGWTCRNCGRVNPSYTGTCGCGMTKFDNEAPEREKALAEEKRAREKALAEEKRANELENLQKLKSYKELLDSGVITQEDFDKKKSELLNL